LRIVQLANNERHLHFQGNNSNAMAVRVARAPQQFSRHAAEQLDEKNSKCRVVTPHILTYFSQLLRVTEKKRRSEKTDSIEDRSDVYIKMSLSYIPVKTSVI